MSQEEHIFDLVIIGAAAAGCTAAIYAARRNLNTVIVTKDIGGEVALSGEVENWPGIENITGFQLAQNFHKHVESYNVPIHNGMSVTAIKQDGAYQIIEAENYSGEQTVYKSKAVVIGSGIHPRQLGVPGEKELKGRGVTYCTVCDGPFFKDKTTATIGAGNAAVESALMMAEIASKVYVVTKYGEDDINHGFPKAENILVDKMRALPNVEIIYNAQTNAIKGEKIVQSFCYYDTKTEEEHTIDVDGIMVHIGMIPNSNFVDCVEKNKSGEIIIDTACKTNCPGVFAAGDVTNTPYKQISISVGLGATAALSAIDYINHWKG